MAIYTIADPLGGSGAVAVKVTAGIAYMGENIDLTAGEVTALTPAYDLRSGVVAVTPKVHPYRQYDSSVPRGSRTL